MRYRVRAEDEMIIMIFIIVIIADVHIYIPTKRLALQTVLYYYRLQKLNIFEHSKTTIF